MEREQSEQAAEEEGDDRDDDQPRYLGMDKLLPVGHPLVEHAAKKAAFAEDAPPQGHQEVAGQGGKKHAKTPSFRLEHASYPCSSRGEGAGQSFVEEA